MSPKTIVAFAAAADNPQASVWRPLASVAAALQVQDRAGRDCVLWASTVQEGSDALAARFPSRSGYSRILAGEGGNDDPLFVLPANWAVVPASTDPAVIRELLRQRYRVGAWLPTPVNFGDLQVRALKCAPGSRWHELRLPQTGGAAGHRRAWLWTARDFCAAVAEELTKQLPPLLTLSYHQRWDAGDDRTATLARQLTAAFADWRTLFGARRAGYRRLPAWRALLAALGNQPLLRRFNRYALRQTVAELAREIVAAQRRRVRGVPTARQWPVAELLKDQSDRGWRRLLYYRRPTRRKKHAPAAR